MMKKWVLGLCLLLVSSATFAKPVPNFAFKDINGKQHRISDYRGKWLIINYWSTYCAPCLQEIPALRAITHRYKGRVAVLGMDAGETPAHEMRQFMRRRGINYTVAPTQDSTMFSMGLIYGVPTTFIVNPRGQIVDTHMGVVSVGYLQSYINGQRNGNRTVNR